MTPSPKPSPSPTSQNSTRRQSPTSQKKEKSGRKSPLVAHNVKKLKKFLEAQGYVLINTTGSHNIYKNEQGRTVALAYHNEAEDLYQGFLKGLADDIGWDVNELNDYLLSMKG